MRNLSISYAASAVAPGFVSVGYPFRAVDWDTRGYTHYTRHIEPENLSLRAAICTGNVPYKFLPPMLGLNMSGTRVVSSESGFYGKDPICTGYCVFLLLIGESAPGKAQSNKRLDPHPIS